MDQNELLNRLTDLLPAQFAEVLFRIGVPTHYLSREAPQTTQAIEVLRYLTQNGRLSELEKHVARAQPALAKMRVDRDPPRASRGTAPGAAAQVKILFLAANPKTMTQSELGEEARSIQHELERSGYRERFVFETRWAVEPLDLLREIRKLKPAVVHFSGHGGEILAGPRRSGRSRDMVDDGAEARSAADPQGGLCFQAADGSAQVVSTEALARTFGAAGSSVRLVVLNACYSEVQAEALATHVGCVIGMTSRIDDGAARSFSIGFYGGLSEAESIEDAFQQGCAAISLTSFGDCDVPRLKTRKGVDARRLILATETDSMT